MEFTDSWVLICMGGRDRDLEKKYFFLGFPRNKREDSAASFSDWILA